MIESKIVNEWKAAAALKAIADGFFRITTHRFGAMPKDLQDRVRSCNDQELLLEWVGFAVTSTSWEEFCRAANL